MEPPLSVDEELELRLVREHESILQAREKLEEDRRRVEEARDADRKSALKDRVEAERRVDDLIEAADTLKKRIDGALEETEGGGGGDRRLNDLRENYWAMVRNVKPVWEEECKEHEERKKKREGKKLN